jgi:peptide/nickel transport system substrate-binding protein
MMRHRRNQRSGSAVAVSHRYRVFRRTSVRKLMQNRFTPGHPTGLGMFMKRLEMSMKRSLARARMSAGLLCVAVVIALGLGACSSGAPAKSGSSGTTSGPSGTLTLASTVPPESLNPAAADTGTGSVFAELAYDSLIHQETDGTLQPGLATKWGYVGGANKTFKVTLRQGVKFANGEAVTPQAVANSLNYFIKHGTGPTVPDITGATATASGPQTVTISSPTPNPILPELLTQNQNFGDIISPAGLRDPASLSTRSSGGGPYVLDTAATVSGSSYTYTLNSNFWDTSEQHFKKVVIKVIPDLTSQLEALEAGQVNFMLSGESTLVDTAKAAGLAVLHGPLFNVSFFITDLDGVVVPGLKSVAVRQALNYGINRVAISKALFASYGSPDDEPNTVGQDGYDPALANYYAYDPAKAKSLLAKAGYPHGLSIPANYYAVAPLSNVAIAVADQLKQIGVTLVLQPDASLTSWFSDLTSKKYAMTMAASEGASEFLEVKQNWLNGSVLNPFADVDPSFVNQFQLASSAMPDKISTEMRQVGDTTVTEAFTLTIVQYATLYFAQKGYSFGGQNAGPAPLANVLNITAP